MFWHASVVKREGWTEGKEVRGPSSRDEVRAWRVLYFIDYE
jgi:hypothetical protein